MGLAAFIVRFVTYALVLAVAWGIAQYFWARAGLDAYDALGAAHSLAAVVVACAPLALAALAIVSRPLAIFLLFYLAGALLTAPFALARAVAV